MASANVLINILVNIFGCVELLFQTSYTLPGFSTAECHTTFIYVYVVHRWSKILLVLTLAEQYN